MRLATSTTALFLSLVGGAACAQQPTAPAHAASAGAANVATMSRAGDESGDSHASDLKWGPAPAIFPPGAQMAVMQGDPGSSSLFTVRLRFPDGYRIPPHTHPTDEHVTVIEGTFLVGMGATVDRKSMLKLKEDGFITAPAGHAHYAAADGRTIVQVHAIGPFAMTYVNPADTPAAAR